MKPYLFINKKEWSYIKNTFDAADVKESLAEVAMGYELPYINISKIKAHTSLQKLKSIQWLNLLTEGEWFSRGSEYYKYNITYNGKFIYFKRLIVGNESSNFFQQKNRWTVDGSGYPSPSRTWSSKKYMTTLMGAAYTLKFEYLNKSSFRDMIGLRKYICSQFKPSIAKSIYDMFNSENILDFSAGWGDRLAGFYASETGKFYVGIDPKKENHPLYNKQCRFYNKHASLFENKKTSKFICQPAEDVDFSQYKNVFDTVFTSPPYFSVERYSADDTQSWKRYSNIQSWNKNFLHKTINNLWCSIKPGGYLLINISDIYKKSTSNKTQWLKICDPMNDFISTLPKSKYIGCIGMEMSRRPNSPGAKTTLDIKNNVSTKKIFAEPIWVWKKQ